MFNPAFAIFDLPYFGMTSTHYDGWMEQVLRQGADVETFDDPSEFARTACPAAGEFQAPDTKEDCHE